MNVMWDIAGMGWSGGKSEPRRVEERCAARGVQREVCSERCAEWIECMRCTRVNKWSVHSHHIMAADCKKCSYG